MIPSSKWSLHKFFSRNPAIRRYLPPTSLFHRASLEEYVNRYGSVYIKPSSKHMGKGIIKVWKTANGYRYVRERGEPAEASTWEQLYQQIEPHTSSARHIIQKGIDLAEVRGRPFDIRVMMMRDGKKEWRYAGMLAKVAGARSIITNVARGGGHVLKVSQAIKQSGTIDPGRTRSLIRHMIRLSHQVCRHFNRYKYSAQIGIDYAVDKKGNLSIIEVNFDFPSHGLFAKLPDLTYYHRIKRLARQHRLRVKRRPKRS